MYSYNDRDTATVDGLLNALNLPNLLADDVLNLSDLAFKLSGKVFRQSVLLQPFHGSVERLNKSFTGKTDAFTAK